MELCVGAYICIEQNELIMREKCMLHNELCGIRRRKRGRRRGRKRGGGERKGKGRGRGEVACVLGRSECLGVHEATVDEELVYLMIVFLWLGGVGLLGARVAVNPVFCP